MGKPFRLRSDEIGLRHNPAEVSAGRHRTYPQYDSFRIGKEGGIDGPFVPGGIYPGVPVGRGGGIMQKKGFCVDEGGKGVGDEGSFRRCGMPLIPGFYPIRRAVEVIGVRL